MTRDEFIDKAKIIEDKSYDYSKVAYKGSKSKVCIICPIHGEFWIRPNDFLNGHMCRYCGIERRKAKRILGTDSFISKAKALFPQYDYSLVDYKNSHSKIRIICPKHGEFEIMPYHILNGHGCKKCGQEAAHDKERKNLLEFINEAISIHGNAYDYSKTEYVNNTTKTCLVCPRHGEFWITPHAHINGKQGCPICNESKLEKEIKLLLNENKIDYIQKKHFKWLGRQHLDFYLPKYNMAIECQGIQHFKVVSHFGGEETFRKQLERDKRKKRICKENNIPILYYSQFKHDGVYRDKELLIKNIKKHESEENQLFE